MKEIEIKDVIGREFLPGDVVAITARDRYTGNNISVITRFSYNKKDSTIPSRVYYLRKNWRGDVTESYKSFERGIQKCVVLLKADDDIRSSLSFMVKEGITKGFLPADYKIGNTIGISEEEVEEVITKAESGVSLLRGE
jgi:hypothetical protein